MRTNFIELHDFFPRIIDDTITSDGIYDLLTRSYISLEDKYATIYRALITLPEIIQEGPLRVAYANNYNSLNGLKFHFSNGPLANTTTYYQLASMTSPDAKQAWMNFLTDLEINFTNDSSTLTKNDIARLVSLSVFVPLYENFTEPFEYLKKYMDDPEVSSPIKGTMAMMALLNNINNTNELYWPGEALKILYHPADFITPEDKNEYLKLILTLGTSPEGELLAANFASNHIKADFSHFIYEFRNGYDPENLSLIADAIALLDDFEWQALSRVEL